MSLNQLYVYGYAYSVYLNYYQKYQASPYNNQASPTDTINKKILLIHIKKLDTSFNS